MYICPCLQINKMIARAGTVLGANRDRPGVFEHPPPVYLGSWVT